MIIGKRSFDWGARTYLMGILNITADSFSGDGILNTAGQDVLSLALEQARRFVAAGVDFLDVGGESTRPGAQPLGLEEELQRVVPVIRAITAELDVPVSVDTYKARVAEAALQAGAHVVNDVWGFRADPDLHPDRLYQLYRLLCERAIPGCERIPDPTSETRAMLRSSKISPALIFSASFFMTGIVLFKSALGTVNEMSVCRVWLTF